MHVSRFLVIKPALLSCLLAGSPAFAGGPLVDKTLVAWACLTNTQQRGGGVLTLIDDAERFDAIVFGEISPGRWMAGSDFFRRTTREQSACPPETADANTFVQIAIVYDSDVVMVYRNGKPYAPSHDHPTTNLQGRRKGSDRTSLRRSHGRDRILRGCYRGSPHLWTWPWGQRRSPLWSPASRPPQHRSRSGRLKMERPPIR